MTKSAAEVEALKAIVVAAALEVWRLARENMLAEHIARDVEHSKLATSEDALAVFRARTMAARAKSYMFDADLELMEAAERLESAMKGAEVK